MTYTVDRPRAHKTTERWSSTERFSGAEMPRWHDKPDGEKITSMVLCKCGSWWKDHAFATGACPIKGEA